MNRDVLVSRPENSDDLRRRMLNALLAVILVLTMIVVVGCGDGDGGERSRGAGNQTAGPRDTGGASAEMPGSSSMNGGAMQAQAINVTLKDGEIAMPTIIKPGATTFHVTNAGQQKHTLRIEGNGQESGIGADLAPGESATMDLDLVVGTYTARCPVDDHNVSLPITVQP